MVQNSMPKNFLFEAFFGILRIFGSVQPKSEYIDIAIFRNIETISIFDCEIAIIYQILCAFVSILYHLAFKHIEQIIFLNKSFEFIEVKIENWKEWLFFSIPSSIFSKRMKKLNEISIIAAVKLDHDIMTCCYLLHTYTHTPLYVTSPPRATWIFLHTLLERVNHQYLNGQHLACEVRTEMCEILTKSGLSFMVKMIREIISIPRADSGYPHNSMVNSWVLVRIWCQNQQQTSSVSARGWKSTLGMESTCTESALGTSCQHTHTHM